MGCRQVLARDRDAPHGEDSNDRNNNALQPKLAIDAKFKTIGLDKHILSLERAEEKRIFVIGETDRAATTGVPRCPKEAV